LADIGAIAADLYVNTDTCKHFAELNKGADNDK